MHVALMSARKVHNPRTTDSCRLLGSMGSGVCLDLTNQQNTIYLQLLVVPKLSLWGYFHSIIAGMRTDMAVVLVSRFLGIILLQTLHTCR